jgi:hypothetical protein
VLLSKKNDIYALFIHIIDFDIFGLQGDSQEGRVCSQVSQEIYNIFSKDI